MNILVSVNNKYLPHLKVMLDSLKTCNPGECIEVYMLNKHLTEKECTAVGRYLNNKGIQLNVIKIKDNVLDDVKVGMHFSVEIMYRLLATELLPEEMDRVLWLDADIVINGDITDFYYTDFEGAYACVCQGRGNYEEHKKNLEIPQEHVYFNSGVMLMNLKKMREARAFNTYVQILKKFESKLIYNDQDILNIAYSKPNDLKYFNQWEYNCQIGLNFRFPDNNYKCFINNCRILHFAATSKPWNKMYRNHLERFYWKYAIHDGRIPEFLLFLVIAPISTMWSRYRTWKAWGIK